MSVDKTVPKLPKATVTKLDVTQRSNQLLVLDWIKSPQVDAVFLAPPCGTASMARNIVLHDEPDAPVPLRSHLQPDGLDGLEGLDFLRVEQANILYSFAAECFDLCTELGKPCLIENPANSLFWETTMWRDRSSAGQEYTQLHQACSYGSSRPKWTNLTANFPEVSTINGVCLNDHPHSPWGFVWHGNKRRFATALEVHYPVALCNAICEAFCMFLVKQGFTPAQVQPAKQ